ncbi:MAG: hypothetical protein FWD57_15565, partial [Polyangiaceae bacterium]|nr:hypothetical protein [Polyangiaceae bacterium]
NIADPMKDFFGERSPDAQMVERAREVLEREQQWVREQLERMKRAASERDRGRLMQESRDETELADRALRIIDKVKSEDIPMPQSTLEMLQQAEVEMRDAAKALGAADGEKAITHQRSAQRLLDSASDALVESRRPLSQFEEQSSRDGDEESLQRGDLDGDRGKTATGPIDIPSADAFRGPEAFRRRVVEGLGGPAEPSLSEALRRYTEGLLR